MTTQEVPEWVKYWSTPEGLKNHAPAGKKDFSAEGFDASERMAKLIYREFLPFQCISPDPSWRPTIVEFGCGAGRMCAHFPPSDYMGCDVSEAALALAREDYDEHFFVQIGPETPLPKADAVFAYTVLLHVPDEALSAVVKRLADCAPLVIVAEILGRKWRRAGNPPVFNREKGDYEAEFAKHGLTLLATHEEPYQRYQGTVISFLQFGRRGSQIQVANS